MLEIRSHKSNIWNKNVRLISLLVLEPWKLGFAVGSFPFFAALCSLSQKLSFKLNAKTGGAPGPALISQFQGSSFHIPPKGFIRMFPVQKAPRLETALTIALRSGIDEPGWKRLHRSDSGCLQVWLGQGVYLGIRATGMVEIIKPNPLT